MAKRMGFALSVAVACALAAAAAFAESHVRIVRLSYVDGTVMMDRAGQGLEKGILNTPVVEGTRIVTGSAGLAEVEFEDQSALRLTGDTEVKFRRLLLNDAGDKVNDIEVVKGTVFVDARSKSADLYRLSAADSSFVVRPGSQMRLSASPDQVKVAVFKGDVLLQDQPQLVSIKKQETLTLDPQNPAGYSVAKGTETLPIDAWNKEREAYDKAYAQNEGYSGPKAGYGLQDLNYYGNFFYASGYGYVWQPFAFAGFMSGWDPYMSGAWMFYPGMGYMWASDYPWGWLPYHYGGWTFINGVGWVWVPGGIYGGNWYYNNFQRVPKVLKPPPGWKPAPPPAIGTANSPKRTVLVGRSAGAAARIPGGRVPPNFASVVPGRIAGPRVFDRAGSATNARRRGNVFVGNNTHPIRTGHVFLPPAAPAYSGAIVGRGPQAISGGAGLAAAPGPSAISGAHPASTGHGAAVPHR
jgi:Family of unknown function (DUF6600)/FecR protein